MAGYFPQNWLNEVVERNRMIDVVNAYVPLTRKGKKYWGLCPFHSEKTASFSVDEEKQLYHCFGCKAGGNIIHFVMNLEKLSFQEAVLYLADRVGLSPPDLVDKEAEQDRRKKQRLYDLMKDAAKAYHLALMTDPGKRAREYLTKRNITPVTITRFGMGYADDSWTSLTDMLLAKGYLLGELEQAGIAITRKGRSFDFFRDRIIFPIIDQYGKVLGFGGRVIDTDGPKYINTPDTPVYNKRRTLYGLNFHKNFSKERQLIVVEGYLDLIAVSNAGISSVVANLGTSLTTEQARLMRRFADTVYIAYDGDSAGQAATLRGLDILSKEGLDVRVISLSDNLDPDDFIRQHGAVGFRNAMEQAVTLMSFKFSSLAAECGLDNDNGRMSFAKKACPLLRGLEPIEQERYIKQVAGMTGFSVDTIRQQIGSITGEKPVGTIATIVPREKSEHDLRAERQLIAVCANHSDLAKKAMRRITPDDFSDPLLTEIWRIMGHLFWGEITPSAIVLHIEDKEKAAAVLSLLETDVRDLMNETALAGLICRVLLNKEEQEIARLSKLLSEEATDRRKILQIISQKNEDIATLKRGEFPTRRETV